MAKEKNQLFWFLFLFNEHEMYRKTLPQNQTETADQLSFLILELCSVAKKMINWGPFISV